MTKLAVILERGLVQCVVSDDPALVNTQVYVIDYDTSGANEDEIYLVPQGEGGQSAEAVVVGDRVIRAGIDLEGITSAGAEK